MLKPDPKRDLLVLNLAGFLFAGGLFHSFATSPDFTQAVHGPNQMLLLAVACAVAGVIFTSIFNGIFRAIAVFSNRPILKLTADQKKENRGFNSIAVIGAIVIYLALAHLPGLSEKFGNRVFEFIVYFAVLVSFTLVYLLRRTIKPSRIQRQRSGPGQP